MNGSISLEAVVMIKVLSYWETESQERRASTKGTERGREKRPGSWRLAGRAEDVDWGIPRAGKLQAGTE